MVYSENATEICCPHHAPGAREYSSAIIRARIRGLVRTANTLHERLAPEGKLLFYRLKADPVYDGRLQCCYRSAQRTTKRPCLSISPADRRAALCLDCSGSLRRMRSEYRPLDAAFLQSLLVQHRRDLRACGSTNVPEIEVSRVHRQADLHRAREFDHVSSTWIEN